MTEQPRTAAGRAFIDMYDRSSSKWNVPRHVIRDFVENIEAEAASPSREALAAALDEARRTVESPWYMDFFATRKRVADAILAALPEWADPGTHESNPDGTVSWRSSPADSGEPRPYWDQSDELDKPFIPPNRSAEDAHFYEDPAWRKQQNKLRAEEEDRL